MRVVGKVDQKTLFAIKQRGLAPGEAVQALIEEAKRRNPEAGTVIIQPSTTGNGFDIVALD